MNTMLFLIVLLLNTIYTVKKKAIINNGYEALQIDDYNKNAITDINDCAEYYNEICFSRDNNRRFAMLYNYIVEEFVRTFTNNEFDSIQQKDRVYKLEIVFPTNYDTNYIKNFCDEIKKNIMKINCIKETDLNFDFECVYNLFIEFATFATNTMETVYNIRENNKDDIEFRKALKAQKDLFEKFLFSVNWFNQISDKQFEFSLLHNFEKIESKVCTEEKNKSLLLTYDFYIETNSDEVNTDIIKKLINIIYSMGL
ncbi:hypothetical protein BDAP_001981 [Binucleata daphniae]